MPKLLTVIAVILIIAQAIAPASRQTSDSSTQTSGDVQKQGRDEHRPSQPSAVFIEKDQPSPTQRITSSPSNENGGNTVIISEPRPVLKSRDWADWSLWCAQCILAVIAMYGICLAYRTLKVTEMQASAAKDAASAANMSAISTEKQVEIAVNAERAWVFEELRFPKELPFQPVDSYSPVLLTFAGFNIRNRGRSVARITAIRLRFHKNRGKLIDSPNYDWLPHHSEIGDDGYMLAPNQQVGMHLSLESGCLSEDEAAEVRRGDLDLYIYGLIEYETIGINRITQFCYTWPKDKTGLVTELDQQGFRKGGPPGYNRTT